jgi:hypothetical protein
VVTSTERIEELSVELFDTDGLTDEQISEARKIIKEGMYQIGHRLGMALNLEFDEMKRRFPKRS